MELGDGAEVDRESELDLLTLAQTQIGGLDEHAGGTEIHRAAQLPASAGDVDVDGGSGSVPGMQSAFHGSWPLIFLFDGEKRFRLCLRSRRCTGPTQLIAALHSRRNP